MKHRWKGKYRVEQEGMKREERDNRMIDHHEEYLLKHIDCPPYHGHPEGVGSCEANKMRSCLYELGQDCELYQEMLKELGGE